MENFQGPARTHLFMQQHVEKRNSEKTAEFVTVFSTGLDKQEIIKGMPPFFTMTSVFAGSAL
jgi:hypothetical protein